MKLRNVIVSCATVIMIFGSSLAYAATSSATISYFDTSKDGSVVNMSGSVALAGNNSSSSDNTLWVELYRRDAGFDDRKSYDEINIGGSSTWSYNATNGLYYIHLDPDGPLYDSCIGDGSATN